MKKEKIESEIIKVYKPLFDLYPTLEIIPIYAWGRYYKYECAGGSFECYGGEKEFGRFIQMCNRHSNIFSKTQITLLEEIDNKENSPEGKLYTCEIGDFLPSREDCVRAYNFDDRAGRCLIMIKKNDGFSVECIICDSPE